MNPFFPARHWHPIPDGRIACDVCPRHCRLGPDQAGLCRVRTRRGNELVLTTYGRAAGLCIDPIEKKPLHHVLPGTKILSFGTAGCNLVCKFCQNWTLSRGVPDDHIGVAADPVVIADTALSAGCRSVAYTYNEPTVFFEYAMDVAAAARERGLRNIAVTAGYIEAAPRAEFYRLIDAANVDLKGFSEAFYRRLTGAHLAPVLETLTYLVRETPVWVEITALIIPGANDDPRELAAMAAWIAETLGPEVPLHLSAFHPDWRMRDTPPTPVSSLIRARDIALAEGLRHVYLGNVDHRDGGVTICAGCGARLIGRERYRVTEWGLDAAGRCRRCARPLAGLFDDGPGGGSGRPTPLHPGAVFDRDERR